MADVRMRGFSARQRVQEAWEWVDAAAGPLAPEPCSVEDCVGRVLAEDMAAPLDVPAFERAAMDGYALRAAETIAAGDYAPVELRILGQAGPARPFAGSVIPGTAVRVMTGAPLPAGADAVLPAEYAEESAGQVVVKATVAVGQHVGAVGEDVRCGAVVLSRGRRLRPQDAGLLSALGIARVAVVSRPRVRLIVTGDELVAPGAPLGPWQIYDANSNLLRGLVTRDGGLLEHRRLRDDRDRLREALAEPGADAILVSGGTSVGSEDHAPTLVAELGELPIHGVAMRPSSPAGMGRIGSALVFLVPGNPVSCLCAYDFFAGRAIRRLGGGSGGWPYATTSAPLARKLVSAIGRVDYARVRLTPDGLVEPLALSGASILSSTVRADGFVIVPEASEGCAAGATVTVYLYDLPSPAVPL